MNELDPQTFQNSISDGEWLKALGKEDEELPHCRFELYSQICESYEMWEKANSYYLKAFTHQFASTERSNTHLNVFDELKMNEPSSPYEEKEKVETRMQNLLFYLEEEHLKHNSSTDSMKPLYESSPETNHVEEEDCQPENAPVA